MKVALYSTIEKVTLYSTIDLAFNRTILYSDNSNLDYSSTINEIILKSDNSNLNDNSAGKKARIFTILIYNKFWF
ncbi:hypothetical protein COTS27_01066 [Spirochaetota bacterium]|nr:hypothetical protein COTS27_01066 [Spirochaetota bacterium]